MTAASRRGPGSSINGGSSNEANARYSTVSGGLDRIASDIYDWVGGSLEEDEWARVVREARSKGS